MIFEAFFYENLNTRGLIIKAGELSYANFGESCDNRCCKICKNSIIEMIIWPQKFSIICLKVFAAQQIVIMTTSCFHIRELCSNSKHKRSSVAHLCFGIRRDGHDAIKKFQYKGAALAHLIPMRLPSCHPGFESQEHHRCFYHLKSYLCYNCQCEKDKKKQKSFVFVQCSHDVPK